MSKIPNTKPKKKKYVMKTSESEVYRQEHYRELVVEDYSGILQKEGVLQEMYDAMANYSLQNYVAMHFEAFQTDVRFKTRGTATYVKVIIQNKPWFEKVLEIFKKK